MFTFYVSGTCTNPQGEAGTFRLSIDADNRYTAKRICTADLTAAGYTAVTITEVEKSRLTGNQKGVVTR